MILDWTCAPLSKGLACYRREEFFEAHEHWECVWLTLAEPEKSFLQAIIQITAALHHLRAGNRVGAASLLRRSHDRLAQCPSEFGGMNVATLRAEVSRCFNEIAIESGAATIKQPAISPIDARM